MYVLDLSMVDITLSVIKNEIQGLSNILTGSNNNFKKFRICLSIRVN